MSGWGGGDEGVMERGSKGGEGVQGQLASPTGARRASFDHWKQNLEPNPSPRTRGPLRPNPNPSALT